MADTAVECLVCKQQIEVPANYVDKNWRCPRCQTRFVPARQADGQLVARSIDGEPLPAQAHTGASPASGGSSGGAAASFGYTALGLSFAIGLIVGMILMKMMK